MVYLKTLFHNKLRKQEITKDGVAISTQNLTLPLS